MKSAGLDTIPRYSYIAVKMKQAWGVRDGIVYGTIDVVQYFPVTLLNELLVFSIL